MGITSRLSARANELAINISYVKIKYIFREGISLKMQNKKFSVAATRVAKQVGQDIETARLKRRLPRAVLAERSGISVLTLGKIINGDTGVSFGRYASVLVALGARKQLEEIISPRNDTVGMLQEEARLPKRVRAEK